MMSYKHLLLGLFLIGSFFQTSTSVAYQALIFDCDGVLVDSEALKFKAWQTVLADIAIDFKEQEYLPLVGFDSRHIANAIATHKQRHLDFDKLIVKKDSLYRSLQKQGVTQLPDAVAFLKLAIANKEKLGLKIAIASSASRIEILENLLQLGVEPASFDFIISGKDDLKIIQDPEGVNKPKPYIYQICAQMLEVDPSQCLVFEDSHAGVIAAKSAGMNVIAIPNAFTKNQDFSAAIKIAEFKEMDITTLVN